MDIPVTLDMLLAARDRRCERQRTLMAGNPGKTLVCLTIVMPGNVKRNERTLKAARAAVEALRDLFDNDIEEFDLSTGFEAYVLVDLDSDETKRLTCGIEDSHPLGRLFDIDVFDRRGLPVSRTTLGLPSRGCLVCGEDARICMRLQRHDYASLLNHINHMIDAYEPTV